MEFLVKRDFCPSCYSQDIEDSNFNNGSVIHSVKLIATPAGFPDEYYVIMARHSKIIFFCRSPISLNKGTEIVVRDNGDGPVCSPST
jgi:hypothetical protein